MFFTPISNLKLFTNFQKEGPVVLWLVWGPDSNHNTHKFIKITCSSLRNLITDMFTKISNWLFLYDNYYFYYFLAVCSDNLTYVVLTDYTIIKREKVKITPWNLCRMYFVVVILLYYRINNIWGHLIEICQALGIELGCIFGLT